MEQKQDAGIMALTLEQRYRLRMTADELRKIDDVEVLRDQILALMEQKMMTDNFYRNSGWFNSRL